VVATTQEISYEEKSIRRNNNNNNSPQVVHQAILLGAYIPLIGVNTPHLDSSALMVLFLLPPFSLLGGLLPLLISSSNFLVFGSCDLQKNSFFL